MNTKSAFVREDDKSAVLLSADLEPQVAFEFDEHPPFVETVKSIGVVEATKGPFELFLDALFFVVNTGGCFETSLLFWKNCVCEVLFLFAFEALVISVKFFETVHGNCQSALVDTSKFVNWDNGGAAFSLKHAFKAERAR